MRVHSKLSALLFFALLAFNAVHATSGFDRAFLGVESNKVSKEKARLLKFENPFGHYVTKVIKNSSAEKAGIQPFDYIYGIDQRFMESGVDLSYILDRYESGDLVKIHLVRLGKPLSLEVKLGSHNSNKSWTVLAGFQAEPFFGVNEHSKNDNEALGVKVNIVKNSTADEMGLRDGDLILSINSQPMIDWSDITTAINNMEVGETIKVEYSREGKTYTGEKSIKSNRDNYFNNSFAWATSNDDGSAYLGINFEKLSESKSGKLGFEHTNGSYVTKVMEKSAAEKAGLMPFDYIYGIDEYRTGEDQSLTGILKKYDPGETVTLHFIRKGQKKSAEIELGSKPGSSYSLGGFIGNDDCDDPFLGVSPSDECTLEKGAAVEIISNSTAAEMGMQDGDIITSINGHSIIDWNDVGTAVDATKVGDNIDVEYLRDGKITKATKPIKSNCDTKSTNKNSSWSKVFNLDFDAPTFNWDRFKILRNDKSQESDERMDLDNVTAVSSDIAQNEAEGLNSRFNIDLPTQNTLRLEKYSLTPNATTDLFELKMSLPERGETSIRLFNDSGRIIYQYDLGNFSGEFSDSIDLGQNGAGEYFVAIKQGAKGASKKITVKK